MPSMELGLLLILLEYKKGNLHGAMDLFAAHKRTIAYSPSPQWTLKLTMLL